MSWQVANRIASVAAAQAHGELGVDPTDTPIQVSPAIDSAGLRLMWQELDGLSGLYLASREGGGVLVSEKLTRAARRHTAAHELGHHRLRHPTTADPDGDIGDPLGLPPDQHRRLPNERAAEAFAAWFLMPHRGVRAVMSSLGLTDVSSAMQVYQLSLHLGTTYMATIRQLTLLRLISQTTARSWSVIVPGTLKRALAGALLESTRDADVWHLERGAERVLYTSPGDLLILPQRHRVRDITGPVEAAGHIRGNTAVRCGVPEDGRPGTAVIQTSGVAITVVVEPHPHGLYLGSTSSPISIGLSS
ncbi:ImmA/IrrE family metallo-endopeptidase [Streptomyces gardneri]|uniref:ImmA/IrrE family metallo-endopeptidase n=1 Tax=Nocardia abscessus TaxID=120957 RepID=UPI0018939DA7|nr:ImmA/IrrE family metallo-endopeptidase [Nocardia abscessus]MBF6169189.1 ImmA/IrrE family metallo-endopeptidase [Streptomyces gardneri]MBF6475273.1 ImmA/IrrE family metallo-endopeptidase [Nocardia abscessus]